MRLWQTPTPEKVDAARGGCLPSCVTVVLHTNARGRPVPMSGVNLNDVVLGRGFWVRTGDTPALPLDGGGFDAEDGNE
jgi:hypothetical protein